MFNFFKKKGGKVDAGTAEGDRWRPTDATGAVDPPSRSDNDVTNEKRNPRKDVVNLLIPETDYNQKTGVGALLQIMAGKRKKGKRRSRTESVRVSPQKEMNGLQRSTSEREPKRSPDVQPTLTENSSGDAAGQAEFVKALVLQKYANKTPEKQHVSLVYVSNESDEKRQAEALLREIARSIDCTIDKIKEATPSINEKDSMGATDSKNGSTEPLYETIDENRLNKNNNTIDSYKSELKGELEKLLNENKSNEPKPDDKLDNRSLESPGLAKKSNLKPPRSDTEGCSDDDRSDCGKKRVTFRKHIVFDDGDQQTDDEVDYTFESLTSEEEEDEYLEDTLPDNDESLGGFVVSRNDENKTVIKVIEPDDELENDGLKRISSDNSDSGFLDSDKQTDDLTSDVKTLVEECESDSEVSGSESEEEIIEIVEESTEEIIEPSDKQ